MGKHTLECELKAQISSTNMREIWWGCTKMGMIWAFETSAHHQCHTSVNKATLLVLLKQFYQLEAHKSLLEPFSLNHISLPGPYTLVATTEYKNTLNTTSKYPNFSLKTI